MIVTSKEATEPGLQANSHIPQALAAMQGLFHLIDVKGNDW